MFFFAVCYRVATEARVDSKEATFSNWNLSDDKCNPANYLVAPRTRMKLCFTSSAESLYRCFFPPLCSSSCLVEIFFMIIKTKVSPPRRFHQRFYYILQSSHFKIYEREVRSTGSLSLLLLSRRRWRDYNLSALRKIVCDVIKMKIIKLESWPSLVE